MNASHSSNIPTVDEPNPNSAMKIGITISELFPLKIFSRKTTKPSNAPLFVINETEANAMNTKIAIPAASHAPSYMHWNILNSPTGVASTSCHVPATATIRPASFSTRSKLPAGIIQVRIVHKTIIANKIT